MFIHNGVFCDEKKIKSADISWLFFNFQNVTQYYSELVKLLWLKFKHFQGISTKNILNLKEFVISCETFVQMQVCFFFASTEINVCRHLVHFTAVNVHFECILWSWLFNTCSFLCQVTTTSMMTLNICADLKKIYFGFISASNPFTFQFIVVWSSPLSVLCAYYSSVLLDIRDSVIFLFWNLITWFHI